MSERNEWILKPGPGHSLVIVALKQTASQNTQGLTTKLSF